MAISLLPGAYRLPLSAQRDYAAGKLHDFRVQAERLKGHSRPEWYLRTIRQVFFGGDNLLLTVAVKFSHHILVVRLQSMELRSFVGAGGLHP